MYIIIIIMIHFMFENVSAYLEKYIIIVTVAVSGYMVPTARVLPRVRYFLVLRITCIV